MATDKINYLLIYRHDCHQKKHRQDVAKHIWYSQVNEKRRINADSKLIASHRQQLDNQLSSRLSILQTDINKLKQHQHNSSHHLSESEPKKSPTQIAKLVIQSIKLK